MYSARRDLCSFNLTVLQEQRFFFKINERVELFLRDPKVDLQQPSVHWTFVRSHSLIACALGWGGPWNPSIAANGSPCKYVLCVRIIISRLLRNVLANHQPFRTQLEMENKAIFFKPKKKHLHHGVFIKEDLYFFFRGILIVLSPYIFPQSISNKLA